jgi:hypothetical protein
MHNMQKASYLVLTSLGLAVAFNFLFFYNEIGVSVSIFVGILLGAVFLFGLRTKTSLQKTWWMILLITFFAIMPGIRDNEPLIFLDLCAILGLLFLLAHQLAGTPAFLMKIWDYIQLVFLPFRMLASALSTLATVGRIHSNVKNRDVWLRVVRGVIMALPILIIFAVLFSHADMAFSKFIGGFLNITISEFEIQYLILLVFAFTASLSFLSHIFSAVRRQQAEKREESNAPVHSGRGVEVLVFLGLISVLFLVFIGFQITYLFGGEANIIDAGFTYAEYARKGFFELLAVAVLSLLVLLASEKYAGVELKKDRRFMIPALILITEVMIVIASAFKRLTLYIDAYSMTQLRFYVAGFIILLTVLFLILAVKFIKSKREEFFTSGALLSIAGFLVAVNIINSDAFIIKSNIERFNRTGNIDIPYTRDLSADAMPGKIELYKKLAGEDKKVLWDLLQKQKNRLQSYGNWQSANLSRDRALKLLNDLGE